jgi:hypothetical protein
MQLESGIIYIDFPPLFKKKKKKDGSNQNFIVVTFLIIQYSVLFKIFILAVRTIVLFILHFLSCLRPPPQNKH